MRTVLIINPASGVSPLAETHHDIGESIEEMILEGLRTYGIEPEVWHTTLEDPGKDLAKKAADEHVDLVIAAGGDGTIDAVASGLVKREPTLAIILRVPLKIFSIMRGVIGGIFTLFAYQPTKFRISFDDKKRRSFQAIQVTICNAPFYGAHFQIASNILMDDGLLDVVIYKTFSKFEYMRHAISITQGRRIFQPKITHRRVKSLRISADHPVEIQADGLPHGHTPAVVRVVPGALSVRVPTTNVPGLHEESYIETNPDLETSSLNRR